MVVESEIHSPRPSCSRCNHFRLFLHRRQRRQLLYSGTCKLFLQAECGLSRFIQVNKITGNVVGRFPTERPFYTYHPVNAWEEVLADGCSVLLHVDAVVYDEPIGAGGYDEFTLQKLRRSVMTMFMR